jgi:hypothetical protein
LLCGTKAELRQFAAMLTRVNVGKSFEQVNYCKRTLLEDWQLREWAMAQTAIHQKSSISAPLF